MIPQPKSVSFKLEDGRDVTIETGVLARQADGAVVVRCGKTMLLATVVSNKEAKEDLDFLPLSVDYQEKFGASGRIPGSFQRRESRLSDYEVLICRLVDRALRPLFPDNYHADTQVMISLISSERDMAPDCLAALAASSALAVSDIPFNGPISEARVARIDGKFVINPNIADQDRADLDLIIAATMDNVVMVEGEANECSEDDLAEAIGIAHEAIRTQVKAQLELRALVGKGLREYDHERTDEDLKKAIYDACYEQVYAVAKSGQPKKERSAAFKQVLADFLATIPEDQQPDKFLTKKYFHEVEYDAMRRMILDEKIRLDGRKLDEIRPIWCAVDYLPSAHGSSVFTRGETQSLTTVTLGSKEDEQIVDGAVFDGMNRFLLHYNFPGFSTGEVRPNRGPGRREVGHGNLAMRSLKKVLPDNLEENPYVIRIVSDILESNGSSSMATVCAGSLALMDAGVKVKSAVSGIAMGLITDGNDFAVLSDILGDEDHLGDMDFKVTGTSKGITACQMDIKINGLPAEVLRKALYQAREGRLHILGIMNQVMETSREDYKPHTPRIVTLYIDREFIGAVIGPGGKIIQEMQRETGATINIEEVGDQGVVQIYSDNKDNLEAAVSRIKSIVARPDVGSIYEGKVKTIQPFGAFVEFMPGKDGLLHISEITHERLETMDGVFNEGDIVRVQLVEVDKKTGKYRLSAKSLLERPEGMPEPPPRRPRPEGERRDDRRGGGGNRDRGPRRDDHRDRRD